MHLKSLQKRFIASLMLDEPDPILLADLSSVADQRRFDVYRRNWREGMLKALKSAYPIFCTLVGEACFRAVATLFIQNAMSRHFSLNVFGEEFPAFIDNYAKAWSLFYLTDIARLEWCIHTTLLGPINAQFTFDKLRTIPESEQSKVIFTLAENGCLFSATFPVDKIWKAHQEPVVEALHIEAEETRLFIYREDPACTLTLAPLSLLEWQLLKGIAEQQTLEKLYQNFANDETQEVITTLASCVEKGYITGMR